MQITLSTDTAKFAKMIYQSIDESRHGLTRLKWAQDATLESTVDFLAAKSKSTDIIFVVLVSGYVAGLIEFRDKQNNTYQCGLWLATAFRGQGIMKQAFNLAIEQFSLLEPFDRLIAQTDLTNYGSQKVLAGNQFKECLRDDKWVYFERHKNAGADYI